MRNDFRALCAELTEFVARLTKHYYEPAELLTRARAALADEPAVPDGREPASVTGQPSDEELDELAWNWYSKTGSTWYQVEAFRAFARAALARWGNPAPQPLAEELVAWLREIAQLWKPDAPRAKQLTRAAELLQRGESALHRLHRLQQENARFREPERTILCDILANGTLLPDPDGKRYGVQPVPVSERLPVGVEQALIKAECALSDIAEGEPEENEGDADALLQWAEQRAATALSRIRPVMRLHGILTSEWPPLPAHALPVPQGEVAG